MNDVEGTNDGSTGPTVPARGAFQGRWQAARRRAFRKAPWLFPDPELPEMLATVRQNDAQRNQEACLPAEESIGFHALWALEYYAPNHLDGLLDGLTKLGWTTRGLRANEEDIVDWVRRRREHESGGSWLNLGVIRRPGGKRFSGALTAPLPPKFDYAFGNLVSLTPSITCVMLVFVPKTDIIASYERIMRQNYQTVMRRRDTGYSILSPEIQRRDAIRDLRRDMRNDAGIWFKQKSSGNIINWTSGG
jgi:hypothetical protein